jgi:hypothetical protein
MTVLAVVQASTPVVHFSSLDPPIPNHTQGIARSQNWFHTTYRKLHDELLLVDLPQVFVKQDAA